MKNEPHLIKNKSKSVSYTQMTPEERNQFWINYKILSSEAEEIAPDKRKPITI